MLFKIASITVLSFFLLVPILVIATSLRDEYKSNKRHYWERVKHNINWNIIFWWYVLGIILAGYVVQMWEL